VGGQSVDLFEYYLAPYVLKSFKKNLKQHLYDFLDLEGFVEFVNFDKIVKLIDKIDTISIKKEYFNEFYKNAQMEHIFEKSIEKALQKTDRDTYQAMEALIHNLNTMHSRAGGICAR
jgi:ribonucleoside-triphosphate reductase